MRAFEISDRNAMPIYAYACAACGLQKDVMQKMSDAPLTACPECGAEAFSKQLTSAGFQLKGNGYYVTDFKDSKKTATKPEAAAPAATPAPAPVAASPIV
jgi:putative FmdB family regulatory protein